MGTKRTLLAGLLLVIGLMAVAGYLFWGMQKAQVEDTAPPDDTQQNQLRIVPAMTEAEYEELQHNLSKIPPMTDAQYEELQGKLNEIPPMTEVEYEELQQRFSDSPSLTKE